MKSQTSRFDLVLHCPHTPKRCTPCELDLYELCPLEHLTAHFTVLQRDDQVLPGTAGRLAAGGTAHGVWERGGGRDVDPARASVAKDPCAGTHAPALACPSPNHSASFINSQQTPRVPFLAFSALRVFMFGRLSWLSSWIPKGFIFKP